mgnify:CR=1 FL=1
MTNILVCDDDKEIVDAIEIYLQQEGYQIYKAYDGEQAIKVLKEMNIQLLIIDIMMPRLDGIHATLKIREFSSVPIIFLSAKSEDTDKILGLNMGADDYITKPFSVSELIARLEALTRRIHRGSGAAARPAEEPEQLVSGPFVLDEKSRILYKSGKPIDLTQVEFQIMELFFRNPGTALVREKILEGVWGKNYFGDVKIVDVNIRRLRMKIEDDTANPTYITTVWGFGYKWGA